MKRDPLTNCTHPQQDPAINRIYPQGSGIGHLSALYQLYQLYLPQRAYQTIAEEFEYKRTDNHLLENLPDVRYAEEKPDKGDIFYTTEKPDKLFVNFLGVELVCHKCKSIFLSKSLLYKHFKSNCIRQNQGNTVALPPAPVFQRIIKSTTSIKAVGFGYAFKG